MGSGRSAPLLTTTIGVSAAKTHGSSRTRCGAGGGGGGLTGGGGTADLDLPVLGSSVSGPVGSVLKLSTLASEGSPLRSDVPAVVASADGRGVDRLPAFFLPFVVPTVPVLLETVSFEVLRKDEEEVDGDADALEPVVFLE